MGKKNIIIVIVIALAIFFGWYVLQPDTVNDGALNVTAISEEVGAGSAVLLDVRTEAELATDGYAIGSTHFDLARLESGELPDYPTDMKVYVYCRTGARAGTAEEILRANGYTNVENIGGLVDWESAGGGVVK